MRWVSTRVLPEPAPAMMSNGPDVCRTASSCIGLRPSRRWLAVGAGSPPAVRTGSSPGPGSDGKGSGKATVLHHLRSPYRWPPTGSGRSRPGRRGRPARAPPAVARVVGQPRRGVKASGQAGTRDAHAPLPEAATSPRHPRIGPVTRRAGPHQEDRRSPPPSASGPGPAARPSGSRSPTRASRRRPTSSTISQLIGWTPPTARPAAPRRHRLVPAQRGHRRALHPARLHGRRRHGAAAGRLRQPAGLDRRRAGEPPRGARPRPRPPRRPSRSTTPAASSSRHRAGATAAPPRRGRRPRRAAAATAARTHPPSRPSPDATVVLITAPLKPSLAPQIEDALVALGVTVVFDSQERVKTERYRGVDLRDHRDRAPRRRGRRRSTSSTPPWPRCARPRPDPDLRRGRRRRDRPRPEPEPAADAAVDRPSPRPPRSHRADIGLARVVALADPRAGDAVAGVIRSLGLVDADRRRAPPAPRSRGYRGSRSEREVAALRVEVWVPEPHARLVANHLAEAAHLRLERRRPDLDRGPPAAARSRGRPARRRRPDRRRRPATELVRRAAAAAVGPAGDRLRHARPTGGRRAARGAGRRAHARPPVAARPAVPSTSIARGAAVRYAVRCRSPDGHRREIRPPRRSPPH